MNAPQRSTSQDWPDIPYTEWEATTTTLQLWMQIIGKIRLVQTPWTNHSWHAPLYLSTRGLTTSPIPHGGRLFELIFDFIDHQLVIQTSLGEKRQVALEPRSVADFYRAVMAELHALGLDVAIRTTPCEIVDPIPFERDTLHHHYDADAACRFWRALLQADRVFKEFRSRFLGKCSPVHFFWGSFDLAVTRFSGQLAPVHPGGIPNLPDWVTREAYSHQVISAGFWPGGGGAQAASFYSYAYPTPPGFSESAITPAEASWTATLGEFLLPYEAVRAAPSPDEVLLSFLQSTYEAAAQGLNWDRDQLQRQPISAWRDGNGSRC
ncbi:hypothetical protein I1E95_06915 [Synechococcus sp. CBW1107]|uniref:DUF5996 family protein n=1 Tax=Synechococcus sp. CBW1107 TaxID=2789857 RepID=UPI0018CDE65B|nr:DUF5996 family protein [Synechococcus sp. CBW1107]QPN57787.1 hypothetical protein I1E95_06915 [Synechococcus sp. CBW1107]